MSHFIYQTEGFILKREYWNEIDLRLLVLTRELGLLWVEAKGIRVLKSKLRYHLNLYSLANFSLISTKADYWRLVGVETISQNSPFLFSISRRFLVANWSSLINRLLGQRDKYSSLYDDLIACLFILANRELTIDQIKSLEIVFNLRLLSHLGYRPLPKFCQEFLAVDDWQTKAISIEKNKRQAFIREINESINLTNL
ncbi:MAG TPA: DNA repair protein RecO [Candidatus Vogelbacteria bacterium]|nr:DNA repair protein RecO [Candidatus Vogelbacteria bacterium]